MHIIVMHIPLSKYEDFNIVCNCDKCDKLSYQMLIPFSSPCFSMKDVFNYGAVVRLHHVHRYGEPQAEIMQTASHSMTVNLGGWGGGGVSNSHWI
jgi:hypothetical protein